MQEPPIPPAVSLALRSYLMGQGLPGESVDGLLVALSQDLSDGVLGAEGIYAKLLHAASDAAGRRIEALVSEIADLSSVGVAPAEG